MKKNGSSFMDLRNLSADQQRRLEICAIAKATGGYLSRQLYDEYHELLEADNERERREQARMPVKPKPSRRGRHLNKRPDESRKHRYSQPGPSSRKKR